MPSMHMGRKYGEVEVDEITRHDYGPKQGVTTVGVVKPKPHDPVRAAENRAELIQLALSVIDDLALEEQRSVGSPISN